MTKQLIHAYVDSEVYLRLKAKKVNLSSTVNSLLGSFLEYEAIPNSEMHKVEEKIKDLTDKKHELNEELNKLTAMLVHLKQEKSQEKKKDLEEANAMVEGMLNSGVLRE